MNEGRFIAGVRFVVDAVCAHIEKLPIIDVSPQEAPLSHSNTGSVSKKSYIQHPLNSDYTAWRSQQGVKRSCGHSQKSSREER